MLFILFCMFNYYSLTGALQFHKKNDPIFTADLLRAVVNRMNNDYLSRSDMSLRTPLLTTTEDEDEPNYLEMVEDDPVIPSLRDTEYLQHSPLWGHQFMAGGAGEGKQNLKPEGTVPNKNEIKTDAILPAYCNPPNPCPIGFTTNDGCIQQFENTAAFSRKYQAAQQCMCDGEHMFDCPSTREFSYNNDMDFEMNEHGNSLDSKKDMAEWSINPFLEGEMLPIAAKKGFNVGY